MERRHPYMFMSKLENLLDKIVEEVKAGGKKSAAPAEPEVTANTDATTEPQKPAAKTAKAKSAATSSTATPSAMQQLLDNQELSIPRVGDVIDAAVIDISANIVLLDIGPIGTGMVIGREAKSGLAEDAKLRSGSKVQATVVDLDNDDGYIELSIREASYERAWDDLRAKMDNKETIAIKIMDANKGGLMVEINGVTGFLPVSQLSSKNYPRVEDGDKNKILELLKRLIGQELGVRIIDINQVDEKLIVSEKAAHSDRERKVIAGLTVGDTITGEVSGVVDFGAFVKFLPPHTDATDDDDRLEGLIHISELAWQLIDNPREVIKVGDKTEAKIIGIDDTRISLSIKALKEDPWTKITDKYAVGEIYQGKVDKITHFGAFVYLDSDIHGLAHVSEFQDLYPGKKLDEKIEAKKEYMWKILSIEPKEHRMGLVLIDDKKLKELSSTKEDTAQKDDDTAEPEKKPRTAKKK